MTIDQGTLEQDQQRLELSVREGSELIVVVKGKWQLGKGLPSTIEIEQTLDNSPTLKQVRFDASKLESWDTSILAFINRITELAKRQGLTIDTSGLPEGLRRLLAMIEANSNRSGEFTSMLDSLRFSASFVESVGIHTLNFFSTAASLVDFVGRVSIAFAKLFVGKARFRLSDLVLQLYACTVQALPIVSLISFLVGTILAFMGAVQLQQFGATIYIADLVGIGIARDMGAMMTAIIMAGRTGAAYAAELGTMRVSEEIAALQTMGIEPIEFLVLPRFIALVTTMPFLCLYADFLGMIGGASVSAGLLGISFRSYLARTSAAVTLESLIGGLVKATTYGVLIALAGCWRGFQGEASSAAIGAATTAAVVDAIVWIVTACGLFALIFRILNI